MIDLTYALDSTYKLASDHIDIKSELVFMGGVTISQSFHISFSEAIT